MWKRKKNKPICRIDFSDPIEPYSIQYFRADWNRAYRQVDIHDGYGFSRVYKKKLKHIMSPEKPINGFRHTKAIKYYRLAASKKVAKLIADRVDPYVFKRYRISKKNLIMPIRTKKNYIKSGGKKNK